MSRRVGSPTAPEMTEIPKVPDQPEFEPRVLVDSWDAAIGSVASTDPNVQVLEGSKRGPRGPRAAASPTLQVTAEKLAALTKPIFRIVCDMAKVSHLTADELREWSESSAPFAEKYLGKLLQERAETFAFVVATLIIAAPRIEQAMEQAKKDKAREVEVIADKEF